MNATLENLDWETCLTEAEAASALATDEALREMAIRWIDDPIPDPDCEFPW